MRRSFRIPFCAILAVVSHGVTRADSPFERDVQPVVERFCARCHGQNKPKAGINLAKFSDEPSARREAELWLRVADALTDRSMPPEGKTQPDEADRQKAAEAIHAMLAAAASVRDPGPGPIQRLTRDQYNNSIRDLLGVEGRPADRFPADGGGGAGVDNNAATLFVPPILMEKYLDAAGECLDKADPARWRIASPGPDVTPDQAARRNLIAFASRAFRRPVEPGEVDRLITVFDAATARGRSFDESMKSALKAVLVSPKFLFLAEEAHPERTGAYLIDDFELASRLSYFLWSSMPDDILFGLASEGVLHEPETLDAQVKRMLSDPRSRALAEGFAGQWLGVNSLKRAVEPDRRAFPDYDPPLRDAMIEEPIATFATIVRSDSSLLDLIDCDYVFVNERLAKHYGMTGVTGPEFRKMPRPEASRGGLLGMAGVLTLTSYPQRTSPVLRGRWVLDEMLGTPPPPPPPDVRVLSPEDAPKDGKTFRQRLEFHRRNPGCAACHAKIDPPGFGLENFDPVGRFRDTIGGGPLDSTGKLTTGETFRGPAELKVILRTGKREVFARNVASRMLGYALRRGVEFHDAPTIRAIVSALEQNDYRSSVLVSEIVKSYPFLNRRDEPISETPP